MPLLRNQYTGTIITRVFFATLLTFATYNPIKPNWSIGGWVANQTDKFDSVVILVCVAVLILHLMFIGAALKSLGKWGLLLFLFLAAAFTYLVIDKNFVAIESTPLQLLGLWTYSVLIGLGAAFAIIWRRATGQVATTETNDIGSSDDDQN